ncbi:MAG: RagB/SusD family nutrient uptake outer membrane protein [Paludibacter sp.]|nr:RagB/SusD family nutrient uptake outer membrane protein [Paludibacter sp.]
MKKLLKYIVFTMIIASAASCEDLKFGDAFLDKAPGGDVTIDTIFSSRVYAEQFLATAYSSLYYGIPITQSDPITSRMGLDMLEALTDVVQSNPNRGASKYYTGSINAGTENTSDQTKYNYNKEGAWEGIRTAWIYAENVNRVPDMTDAEKKVRAAEAKMIVACHYADMYRHFGGLPWIDKAIYPDDEVRYPRLTVEQTINHIIGLIDEAAADLPWALENITVDDGRFTRAAAMALKIRLLLFTASPLFNDNEPYMTGEAADKKMIWLGKKDMDWYVRAKTACQEFFSELNSKGGYALVNTGNPRADFISAYHRRGNGEILISTRKVYQSGGEWDANYYFYQAASGYGIANPTLEGVDIFQFADGTTFDWNNPEHAANPFVSETGQLLRDPRLYETVTIQGDRMQNKRLDTYISTDGKVKGWLRAKGNSFNWLTGFSIRKFIRERQSGNGYQEVVQWPYLRLAEIYLSYAEILNELDEESTAYSYINFVRSRAGMPDINKNGNLGKEGLRKEILLERVRELMYEDVRWYDIIRWKQADVFQKRLHGLLINCDTNDGKNLKFTVYELDQDRYWRTSFSPKWYLSAFPPDEINKGYGLVQNPGW